MISGNEVPQPPQQPATPPPPPREFSIFLNKDGVPRSGWRLLIYLFFGAAILFLLGFVATFFRNGAESLTSVNTILLQEIIGFAAVMGAAIILSRIEHNPVDSYGLPVASAFGKRFLQGWLMGLAEASALMGLIALFGGYSFGSLAESGVNIAKWAVIWILVATAIGLFEEFLFRGYTQFTLADGIGFWPAAIVLSLAFGAVHLSNPGENWIGVAGVVVTGLVFAFSLKRTGNLWFAVGWHAAFDFGESFLYSVPDSGVLYEGHISNATLHGPAWLTGGTVGPEASVFSFLIMGLAAVAIHFLFPAQKAASNSAQERPG